MTTIDLQFFFALFSTECNDRPVSCATTKARIADTEGCVGDSRIPHTHSGHSADSGDGYSDHCPKSAKQSQEKGRHQLKGSHLPLLDLTSKVLIFII